MKKFLLFACTFAAGIGFANAAVRDASSINRQSTLSQTQNAPTRAATTTARSGGVISRNASSGSRAVTRTKQPARTTRTSTVLQTTVPRTTITGRSALKPSARVATANPTVSRMSKTSARAATTTAAASNTFGTGYNACRDAYFTCMDQFCAKQNETYRRCVCSSRLADIQSRERLLSQTANQLQDFKDLNIEVIPKTSNEVKAMLSATTGETIAAPSKDTSDSAKQLAGISEVLSSTKTKALSTQGTLDIAGDINSIWATTDLTSGAQIANLTGESLYNAVHSQCVDLISSQCASDATLKMVVSAYGMYIENDCTALATALDKKYTAANATIRETETAMHTARLENYDAHNSTAINDCIAQVRKDITADTACGTNYVHCLDVSGKYLNRDTGEPIYTTDFYQLGTSISLSGDILNNQANRMIVNELNRKRTFANRGLETCRDLADDVWEEFMRQAITEIYQGQQDRIRQVKNECLDVVNQCYDTQSKSLKDFSNVKEQMLLGSRLELSEEMCQEKLYACANLYGGGTKGLDELVNAMGTITDQKIAKDCQTTLLEYVKEMCAVPSNDSLHTYPFGCRTYNPGTQQYAAMCHGNLSSGSASSTALPQLPITGRPYSCSAVKQYEFCKAGYYLTTSSETTTFDSNIHIGNECRACAYAGLGCTCPGGIEPPNCNGGEGIQCNEYNNSLYAKLVQYAQQTCVRPTESSNPLPSHILQDVNVVMDQIRIDMAKELAKECSRLEGIWVDIQRESDQAETSAINKAPAQTRASYTGQDAIFDKQTHPTHKKFYIETSASTQWGYCASPEGAETTSEKQKACTDSSGTWNATTNTCTCPTGTTFNSTTNRCDS